MNFCSAWNAQGTVAQQRRDAMLQRIGQLRALEQRAAEKSSDARHVFDKRGQLLPRERVGLLLDPGASFLPLCTLAGYLQDSKDADASVPGGGMIAGIGFVCGVRCMNSLGVMAGPPSRFTASRSLVSATPTREIALRSSPISPDIYGLSGASGKTATLTNAAGKISVNFPEILLSVVGGSTQKSISAMASN